MPISEKEQLARWQKYTDNIRKATPIDINETSKQRSDRIKYLEADRERWINYYFHKYVFTPTAKFQIESSDRLFAAYAKMKLQHFGSFYQCRAWFRGGSKSTRRMFEIFYLKFVEKMTIIELLISKTEKNAQKLLKPYRGHFEANERLIQDYGKQKSFGNWEEGEFTTVGGDTFLAVGREQSPRGAKEEELRVNIVDFDDADDDELCRNPDRLQEAWDWIEQAVIPCVEISKPFFIFFDNNIFAEDQLALRAQKYADDVEIINLTDENGESSWPEKNSPEIIIAILSKMSYANQQREYYNNPMQSGKTFTNITWGACPPLKELDFIVCYSDPSPSNKDHPGQKSGLTNSRKATFIVGRKGRRYYIYFGFLDSVGSRKFIEFIYACRDYINGETVGYFIIENNTLQDPIYSQIYLPLIYEIGEKRTGGILQVSGDDRKKLDKWYRIEATLEPINTRGDLIFNETEKGNEHMLRLEAEFKAAKITSKLLDGIDCIQGAIVCIDERSYTKTNQVQYTPRTRSEEKSY